MKGKTLKKSLSQSLNSQSGIRKRASSIYNFESKLNYQLPQDQKTFEFEFKYSNPSNFQTTFTKSQTEQDQPKKTLDSILQPIKSDFPQTETKKFQNFNFLPNELTNLLQQSSYISKQSNEPNKLKSLIDQFSPNYSKFMKGKYKPQEELL